MGVLEKFPRISTFLWYDGNAQDAAELYVSLFPDSRILEMMRIPDETGKGSVLTVAFELDGVKMTALNGGPMYKFTEAISLVVRCDSQEEIDRYWAKLSEGGSEGQCGWLKDKFGLSWQVTPARLGELIGNPKGFQAMLKMKKLDIAELERASAE